MPTATPKGPGATPTPTEVPPAAVKAPPNWVVMFVSVSPSGSEQVESRIGATSLDYDFPTVPFNDMRREGWKLVAEGVAVLESDGRYTFALEHRGEARVFVDGQEVGYEAAQTGAQTLRATFAHRAGTVTLRIEVKDTGAGVKLRVP